VSEDLREPEPADAVALVRAHLADDGDAVENLLLLVDRERLFPMCVGVLLSALEQTGVSEEELDARLAQWQRDRVLG
jgi:hypothetical protein